jgi:2-polyprenyl-3-methyl-5-hydroxy-6-metoxy-1,4-benzoquinol methylase
MVQNLERLMFCRILAILGFILSPIKGQCQVQGVLQDTLSVQQFITGCAAYRKFAMEGIETALTDFVAISDALASSSNVPNAHNQFRDLIIKAALPENHDSKSGNAPAMLRKMFANDSLSVQVYLRWLEKHYYEIQELTFLVQSEFLEANPPYRMSSPQILWEEIQFYNVRNDMRIADIGAGNGFLGLLLAGTGAPAKVTMTEIDSDMLAYLDQRLAKGVDYFHSTELSVVKAEIKTTQLGQDHYDIIFLREVLHHLSQPLSVLLDCKKHLEPGGSIFLKEGTKDLPGDRHSKCKKAWTYSQVLKMVKKAGFHVTKEKVIDESWILQLKPL